MQINHNRWIFKAVLCLLTLSILSGYVCSSAQTNEAVAASPTEFDNHGLPLDAVESRYRRQIAEVIDLGIFEADSGGIFGCENSITRGELAHTAVIMLGAENTVYDNQPDLYRDLDTSSLYYDDIQIVTALGVMSGFEDRTFRADEAADMNMLANVLVNVLGYGIIAEENGGYENGYLQQASRLGLFDGINPQAANRECFAAMIMNALDVQILTQSGIYGEEYEQGDELLYAGMKLKTVRGQVNTVEEVSLYNGQAVKDNTLKIGDLVFNYSDDIPAHSYIGFEVNAYYFDDEANDELYLKSMRLVPNKNKVLDIPADKVQIGSGATEIIYETEDNTTKSADVSRSADVIYNGRAGGAENIDFSPGSFTTGGLRLIDIDSDGEYDVMIIKKYESHIVDTVLTRSNTIYPKYTGQIELDDEELENIYIDGVSAQMSSIKEWDVLFIMRDKDGFATEILVSAAKVSGKVMSMDEDTIAIDSDLYDWNYEYKKDLDSGKRTPLRVGDTGVFSIDPEGRIAAVNYGQDLADSSARYGYLIRAVPFTTDDETAYIKVYSVQGTMEYMKCAEEIKLNSVKRDVEDVINDPRIYNSNGVVYQLIRYKLNSDGEVAAIDTAVRKDTMLDWIDTSTLTYEERSVVSARHLEEKAYFDDRTFTITVDGESLKLRRGNHSFGSRCYYDASSKALVVPGDADRILDENEYTVYGATELDARSTKSYEVYSYDEDELKVSKVFVMRGAGVTGNVDELSSVFTVSRGKLSYDELLDEAVWELSGIMGGGQLTATPKNDTVDAMLQAAESGDVLQVNMDEKNRISDISKRFSIDYMLEDFSDNVLDNLADGAAIGSKPYDEFDYHIGTDDSNYEHVIGRVTKTGPDRCIISTAKGGVEETAVIVYHDSTDFTVYDSDERRASPGSEADIARGTIVYARIETGFLRDVVVYVNAD